MSPDLWIVLEPGRIFLWPLQSKRRWTWRVISPVGYTHVRGQARGHDQALAAAHHAVRHLPPRPPGPERPNPGRKEHAEAYAFEVIPARLAQR